jgi:succinate dehydrogenase / fumarate reductase, cytochrome b subunit
LLTYPDLAFGKVQHELFVTWAFLFYVVGIVSASWHFAYGLWLFAAKWGITQGPIARRRWGYVCTLIGITFVAVGLATLYSFRSTPQRPYQPSANEMDSYTMR